MKRIPPMIGLMKCAGTLTRWLLNAALSTAQTESTLPAPTGPQTTSAN